MLTIDNLPTAATLDRLRSERYLGEERGMRMAEFPSGDRDLLGRLYTALREALHAAQTGIQEKNPLRTLEMVRAAGWKPLLLEFMAAFGQVRPESDSPERVREVYHDIRGGALSMVNMRVEIAMMKGNEADMDDAHGIFFAARDHLKILRNCVIDIDPPRRQRDMEHHLHSAELLRQKWTDVHAGNLDIEYHSDFDGAISSCCLEFSSLERVLYNLVNNAARHSADGKVRFFVREVRDQTEGHDVQFAVANRVKPEERTTLEQRFGDDLSGLFRGGFTIGGTGVGMKVIAEIVANAYGLTSVAAATEGGYVGAQLVGEEFVAWAHWPAME